MCGLVIATLERTGSIASIAGRHETETQRGVYKWEYSQKQKGASFCALRGLRPTIRWRLASSSECALLLLLISRARRTLRLSAFCLPCCSLVLVLPRFMLPLASSPSSSRRAPENNWKWWENVIARHPVQSYSLCRCRHHPPSSLRCRRCHGWICRRRRRRTHSGRF